MRSVFLFLFWLSSVYLSAVAANVSLKNKSLLSSNSSKKKTLLKGVVILSSEEDLLPSAELVDKKGILAAENAIIEPEALEKWLGPDLFSRTISMQTVDHLKSEMYRYCGEIDQPFVVVSVPPQKISTGVIQVVVAPSLLSEVYIQGNTKKEKSRLIKTLHLKPDEPISSKDIEKEIQFFNKHPFQQASAIFSPGSELRTTDLTISVHEERPFLFRSTTNNSGSTTTGQGRLIQQASLAIKQLFLNVEYISSYDFHRFQGLSTIATIFLPWKHIFRMNGGIVSLYPEIKNQPVHIKSRSFQASLQYVISSYLFKEIDLDIVFGVEAKQANNIAEYLVDIPRPRQTHRASLFQLLLGCNSSFAFGKIKGELAWSNFFSPAKMFPHQNKKAYRAFRSKASPRYYYTTLQGRVLSDLSFFPIFFRWKAQLSSGNLLPMEQLALGGVDSIRGYQERQYSADQGMVASIEWVAFSLPVLEYFYSNSWKDQLKLSLFLDAGYGYDYANIFDLPGHSWLASFGPSLQYRKEKNLFCSLDLGVPFVRSKKAEINSYRLHMSMSYLY